MLKTLELINFRSYKNGLFEFSDGVNIIVGANASGKTNLLEAIHTLCCGKAFKSDDAELVRKDEQWARINASLETHSRSVKIKLVPQEKIFVIDDNEHRRLGVQQIIPFVLFEPENMLLLSGEPERRRVYLDELIAKIDKGYKTLVNNYKRILLQRNRLLKQDSISEDHLFAWDLQMSEIAGKIIERRLEFISRLNGRLPDAYQHVSGNVEESLRIEYLSKLPAEQYATQLLKKLKEDFQLDRLRGFTGVGPHRDDYQFFLSGNGVAEHASRGETRSIILALKILELKFLEEANGTKPILLLDDVFSELDGKRRRVLAQTLQEYQTFITTTDADVVVEHFSKLSTIIPL